MKKNLRFCERARTCHRLLLTVLRTKANREQACKINQKPEKDVSKCKRKSKSKRKSKRKSRRKSKSKQCARARASRAQEQEQEQTPKSASANASTHQQERMRQSAQSAAQRRTSATKEECRGRVAVRRGQHSKHKRKPAIASLIAIVIPLHPTSGHVAPERRPTVREL